MEDHLYNCVYDIQQSDTSPDRKLTALNRYSAKLVIAHAELAHTPICVLSLDFRRAFGRITTSNYLRDTA